MVIKKVAKVGLHAMIIASVFGEAGASHKHHEEKAEKHQQDNSKGGEPGEVPPHSRRIESRVQAREEEIEQSIALKGSNKRGQRNGGGNTPEPFESSMEGRRTVRNQRRLSFDI